jgi:DNA-binding transcriptional ArsR family regulator
LTSRNKSPRIKATKEDRTKKSTQSVASIFKTISDPISVELFKNISETGSDSEDLMRRKKISRRQYYSRLSNFTRNGLVLRRDGKNHRTTFGRVVYHALMTIEKTFVNYYNLKAIDSIGLNSNIPREEHNKIIDTLITDPDIKKILVSLKDKDVIDRLVVES